MNETQALCHDRMKWSSTGKDAHGNGVRASHLTKMGSNFGVFYMTVISMIGMVDTAIEV